MKKFLFISVLFLFLIFANLPVFCAENIVLKECEYTEEFKNYQKLSEKEKRNVIMPEICKSKESVLFKSSINTLLGASITDSKFDLRELNKVTSVKNQYDKLNDKDTNACWAFSTAASIESNLLVKTNVNHDISEGHIELATSKNMVNRNTFSKEIGEGGNYLISSAYLLNYRGPVKEDFLSFENYKKILNKSLEYSTELKSKVSNAKPDFSVNAISQYDSSDGTCNDTIKSRIKKYLIENGALSSVMYADGNYYNNNSYYYYNGEEISNHGVTIVGWNDNILASKFKTNPNTNGAWIVKNSYGTDKYDNGYIYVSYADSNICKSLTGFYNVSSDINDYVYYNDELGASATLELGDSNPKIYAASVYSKKDTNKLEELKRIVFASPSENMEYEIYFSTTGELNKFQKIASGSTIARGYENVNLNDIYITNDKFAVAVKYTDDLPVYANAEGTIFEDQEFVLGTSYVSQESVNTGYVDTSSSAFVVSIKAYTDAVDESEIPTTTPTTTSLSTSISSTKEENDEEENSIEIIENENNEKSYIAKENDVVNPKTADISVDFSMILMIAILGVIALSALKLKNIKN